MNSIHVLRSVVHLVLTAAGSGKVPSPAQREAKAVVIAARTSNGKTISTAGYRCSFEKAMLKWSARGTTSQTRPPVQRRCTGRRSR